MKTVYTSSAVEAADFIRNGGVVAFPTETVFGLGADATSEESVQQIFQAKGRPSDNPLIVHLHSVDQLSQVVDSLSIDAEKLMENFFPGPLSIILPKSKTIPDLVTAGLNTVAVRIPAHPVAASFLQACDVPVAAPSANLSGRPSPTTWQAVQEDLDGRIHAVLIGGDVEHGIESTVIDCTEKIPTVLRAGSLGIERLRQVCPQLRMADPADECLPRSPGTKYRHYSPRAEVIPVKDLSELPYAGDGRWVFLGVTAPPPDRVFDHVVIFPTCEAYAKNLYETFRECDRKGTQRIYCQSVPSTGIGVALNDRLERAAHGSPNGV